MPSKKSTNPKKNKKTKASSAGMTGGADTTSIHQWVSEGRVDAKGLSSSLPGVADAIRDGDIEPEQVPKLVQEANKNHLRAVLEKHLGPEYFQGGGKQITRLRTLEIMTGAEPLLCDLVQATCAQGPLSHAFARDFFGSNLQRWGKVRETIFLDGETITAVKDFALLQEIQQAYDRACEKWKLHIERLAKKPLEKHCLAYKQPLVVFVAYLIDIIQQDQNYSLDDICRDVAHTKSIEMDKKVEAAARGVKNGWDTIRYQCWECGQQCSEVLKCSRCKAARYCSKECQRTSWKAGHRGTCDRLKTMYQGYMANSRRIDQSLKLQSEKTQYPMCEGCPLPPAGTRDYMLLPMLLTHWTLPVVTNIDIVSDGGATIDHMYKSLGEIVAGRAHWMFEETFRGKVPKDLDIVSVKGDYDELDYMNQALLFLAVDISKYLPYEALSMVHLFKCQLRKCSADGELMSVKRFITVYYLYGVSHRSDYEDPSIRLQSLAKCMTIMMKFFHKKTGPVDIQSIVGEVEEFRFREVLNEIGRKG